MFEKIRWHGPHSSVPSARSIMHTTHNHNDAKDGRPFVRHLQDQEEDPTEDAFHPWELTQGERDDKKTSEPQHSCDESDHLFDAPSENDSPKRLDVIA